MNNPQIKQIYLCSEAASVYRVMEKSRKARANQTAISGV